ncbi:sperm flagellar protein 2 [Heptranchias perlo]|uniref:sperm flagellar protein 2 n=1 Tax=Heptranchias perlo TaxID=212740 RepID=UPI003559BD2E
MGRERGSGISFHFVCLISGVAIHGVYQDLLFRLKTMIPREIDVILQSVSDHYMAIGKDLEEQVKHRQEEELQKQQNIQEEQRIQNLEMLRKTKRKNGELLAKIQASIIPISKPLSAGTIRAVQKRKQQLKRKEAEMVTNEINEFEKIMKKLVPPHGGRETDSDLNWLKTGFCDGGDIVLARQEKLEHVEKTQQQREVHERIMAERAEERFRKHYTLCWEVVDHIVDLATKVGEYRQLTLNLIPAKIMTEWKELFFSELPIYDQPVADQQPSDERSEDKVELAKQQLLNTQDYEDYKMMTGEWKPSEDGDIRGPPPNNNILGHVVHRIFEIVNPTKPPTPPPVFPPFPVKACILGKPLAGKSTCLKYLSEALCIQALCPGTLVREAVQAFDDCETVTPDEPQEDKTETGKENQVLDAGLSVPAGSEGVNVAGSEGQDVGAILPKDVPKTAFQSSTKDLPGDLSKILSKGRLTDLTEQSSQDFKAADEPETQPQEEMKRPSQSQTSIASKKGPQPTARALLGARAAKLLRKGKSVPDDLLVEIVVEGIRCLPAERGWILDGFPVNINQAKLLEKGLTGVDPDKAVTKTKRSKTSFAVDPNTPKEPVPPQPALDLAILLDVSDNTVLARHSESTGRSGAEIETQKLPSLKQEADEDLAPTESSTNREELPLPRLTGFLDNWPLLEQWFLAQQDILVKVNGELEKEALSDKLEFILVEALFKKQRKAAVTEKPPELQLPPTPAHVSLPSPEPQGKSLKDGKSARAGSMIKIHSPKEKRKISVSPHDKKQDKSGSFSQSGSAKGKKGKESKGKLEPVSPEHPTDIETHRSPPPKPGSDQWVYVDELVPQEVAEYLAPYWNTIMDTYVNTIHSVMQEQRSERHRIVHYLYKIREEFQEYLVTRPDHKQEFVSQWQDDYNSIPEDLRQDDDMKAELLLRLYNLRECLWDISDNRKEDAERERMNIMGNGWLEDHLGLLLNLYTTLMQLEVDRFQDTQRFLQDYYKGMGGKIPPEESKEFARLPLVSVADVKLPASATTINQETRSALDSIQPDGQIEAETRSPGTEGKEEQKGEGEEETRVHNALDSIQPDGQIEAETRSPGTEGKEEQKGEGEEETRVHKVPLVSYRIPSSSLAVKDKGKAPGKVTGKGKEDVVVMESPPISDVDEYLIFDAYQTATSIISNIIQKEVKMKEDEEKKEQKLKEEKEKELQKFSAGKDGKDAKKKPPKSAEKKKGRQSVTPSVPPSLAASPEEVKRIEVRERIYAEYFGALEEEELVVRTRLELIKLKAMMVVQELKSKAEEVFRNMEDWLGTRFLQEMESINALLDIGLEHVDTGTKIRHQLVLHSKEFFVNGDVKMTPEQQPITRLPSKEIPKDGGLTIEQLSNLHRQFMLVAPTGLMLRKAFIETLQDLVSLDLGSDQLPDQWSSASYSQVLEITKTLTPDTEFVDWRRFLLSAALPWPYPSEMELLDTKTRFQAVDPAGSGYVTQEQYDQVFFTIFVDQSRLPPALDYNAMLLNFAAHRDPAEGFRRALSLASGTLLPWKRASTSSPVKSVPCIGKPTVDGIQVAAALQELPPLPSAEEKVPLSALFKMMTHGVIQSGDVHRHTNQQEAEQFYCKQFTHVYKELGSKDLEPVPFEILLRHPAIMDLITNTLKFTLPDFQPILQRKPVESEVVASSSPELSVETSSNTPPDDMAATRRRIPKAGNVP